MHNRNPIFLHFLKGLAKKIHYPLTDEFDFTVCSRRIHEAGNAIDDEAEVLLARSQHLLSAFAIFKISIRSVPLDDFSRFVMPGASAEQEPSKLPVEAPKATLHFEWLAGIQGFLVFGQHARDVIWMNRNQEAPIHRLFPGKTGIIQPAPIEKFSGTIPTNDPGKRGDRVNYKSQLVRNLGFTSPKLLSRPPAILNISFSANHKAFISD